MQIKQLTGAAVLLALTPAALAIGSASVVNNCDYPIYYASVGQSYTAEMNEIKGNYSEQYSKAGVGISIKLAPKASSTGAISQFEYTWAAGNIFYDLSNIDGYPFAKGGMTITPVNGDISSHPSCVEVDCPAGQALCTAAYNQPDDVRTMVCGENTDLVLTMCPNNKKEKKEKKEQLSVSAGGHVHYRVHARHLPTK